MTSQWSCQRKKKKKKKKERRDTRLEVLPAKQGLEEDEGGRERESS